ncbi:unnamed protein product, partial [Mesorhabditis belari]|uniref:Dolichyl-diphosphooligosaccharide--protein glycosyltransferase subunit 1 n=1 Tax=Mesorhabditis belari TaxID=2138241 RepID=A0AAF3FHQ4_9BILA
MRVIPLLLLVVTGSLANVKITNLDRTVDLSTQIVKGTSVISYESESTVSDVFFTLAENEAEKLAYITAGENGVKDSKLKVVKDKSPKEGFVNFKIALPKPLQKGSSATIKVEYKVTQVLTALPAKITQLENQFVFYDGSAYAPSAYTVTKQKTVVKIPSGSKLQSHTNVSPSSKDSAGVTYGPFENQEPFAEKFVRVHYENNSPFIVATNVERLIEISHWGNIAVEEKIEIIHRGAKLDGPFSRLDYQMDRRGGKIPALQKFKTVLPAAAKDIYYRDVIGNISTSDVQLRKSSVDVEIRPRFPLFGGWKTTYILGYNLPSSEHLYSKGINYGLKMKLYDHIMDNLVVEKLAVKIVLPETARNVKLATPYSVERRPDESIATYLDTIGRTVIVLQKDNLVDSHIQPFTVYYDFDYHNLLREPFLASAFFFLLFLLIIIYSHLDFTIVSDPAKEARDQAQGNIDEIQRLVDKRLRTYDHVAEAARQYKSSRDESALNGAKAKADNVRAELNDSISRVLASLKGQQDVYEKVLDLSKYDSQLKDAETNYLAAVKRSTTKDGPEDKAHATKISETRVRSESILTSL